MTAKPGLQASLRVEARPALLGRLRMAEWLEMPEKEFAREIANLEKDPLFQKLYFGTPQDPGIIRRQGWPQGTLSGAFYELNERLATGSERVRVEEVLGEKAALLPKIRKMGREAFERYFIKAEEAVTLEEIARRTGLAEAEVRAIHDMLLELGAQEEFWLPSREPGMAKAYTCLARLSCAAGEPEFEFFSAHWARGLYRIRYDLLETWKTSGRLEGAERRRLPRLLKRLETVNLRQSTVFRILESLTRLQADFLKSQDPRSEKPISLRQLARRLDLAPSTVSRAISGRSLQFPWGKEEPIISLLPGRRRMLRLLLSEWLEGDGASQTDSVLAERLKAEHGIKVSRRTVNAVRHEISERPT